MTDKTQKLPIASNIDTWTEPLDLPAQFIQYKRYVDSDWNTGNINSNPSSRQVNNYLLFRTIVYNSSTQVDEELHNRFQEDFEGFTQETFEKGNRDLHHELRSTLRRRGVLVHSNNKRIATNLEIALSEEYQDWPQAEIERQNKTRGGFLQGSRQK
ncbi:hypothetical protein GcM1_218055 [Golovinomyces cichoracearum]|uniref:Uncharacterized protein n=1 Tax=Golovinomyces cichoracearum TaxID=62708 RepID=A0A420ISQ6_9PEZI|nr:hypothetical protein GcM1_218055 [Golovinomyces cichoracearum]